MCHPFFFSGASRLFCSHVAPWRNQWSWPGVLEMRVSPFSDPQMVVFLWVLLQTSCCLKTPQHALAQVRPRRTGNEGSGAIRQPRFLTLVQEPHRLPPNKSFLLVPFTAMPRAPSNNDTPSCAVLVQGNSSTSSNPRKYERRDSRGSGIPNDSNGAVRFGFGCLDGLGPGMSRPKEVD